MIVDKLPKEHTKNTIGDVEVGITFYTVPWALHVDKDGYMWLDTKFGYTEHEFGTSHMRVRKISQGEYEINETSLKGYRYDVSPNIPPHARRAVLKREDSEELPSRHSFIDWWRSL